MSNFTRLCMNCKYYRIIPHVRDIFSNDKKKCVKLVNTIYADAGLSRDATVTYHTVAVARYNEDLCGSQGKFFVQSDSPKL
jgi:hypothetical protein